MFIPIGTLIKTLPRRSKTPEAIVALHVRQAFFESVKKICADLPEDLIKSAKPLVFKNKILTVSAPHLVCAELSMRSGGLTREINEVLGKRIVLRIRFKNS